MNFERSGGILLHPTSLPGPYGIGDLGSQSYRFVDWLSSSGCSLWQILPLGPTGFGDSPYQCFSAFAGNPNLISPEKLTEVGLLRMDDLADMPSFSDSRVDFGTLLPWKNTLLRKAFDRFNDEPEGLQDEFEFFRRENASWLDDYSLFMTLKEIHGGGSWTGWPEALRIREETSLHAIRNDLSNTCLKYSFVQFLFHRQWSELRRYANSRGIQIIGDIPIFVANDSADVWSRPELFKLDSSGKPVAVAGVPPDLFSATGQLWGNPLYEWDVHKAENYAWWLSRINSVLQLVDIIRFDHFRGFAGYYEIPADHSTAEYGQWVQGPGEDFFRAVDGYLRDGARTPGRNLPIIAEDLGFITQDVIDLLNSFDLPGMRILQFGFSGPDNPNLPHNYIRNCVAYTGTHDNQTTVDWFATAPQHEREFARRYLGVDGKDIAWDLVREVWRSVAVYAIAPMQDLLGLGGEARMNFPSTLGGNWQWRMRHDDLSEDLEIRMRDLNWMFYR